MRKILDVAFVAGAAGILLLAVAAVIAALNIEARGADTPTCPSTSASSTASTPDSGAPDAGGVEVTWSPIPEDDVLVGAYGCARITSRENSEDWAYPYPWRIEIQKVDCFFFPKPHGEKKWRTAFCLEDDERKSMKLYLHRASNDASRIKVAVGWPKGLESYGEFRLGESCQ